MTQGIYAIVCTKTNKMYIGQSVNIFHRLQNHKSQLISKTHPNKQMQSDFNQFFESFETKIIEQTDKLYTRELYWMFVYENRIYNTIPKPMSWGQRIHFRKMKKLAQERKDKQIKEGAFDLVNKPVN